MEDGEVHFQNRVVHLDLKGAPPKIGFLLKIVPLLRQWGATGLLVEYEDTFPFKNELASLSRKYLYSSDEIRSLQELVKAEGMKYIPLLQSFGHVEFILKHKQFKELREASMNPMSLCPTNKKSLPLIESIVDQFVQEHDDLEYLHIGGDEVFCMAICKDCQSACRQISRHQLYLSHMVPLIRSIQSKYPKLKIMIWDDMFRDFSIPDLESLGSSVIPVVWSYVDDLTGQFPAGMWGRFDAAFDEIWIASSFKGSSGPVCNLPPLMHHINNHLSWIQLVASLPEELQKKIKGIAVTGWSRYDHFATLCELLPTALPSLAMCLQVLDKKCFHKEIQDNVSKELGYLHPLVMMDSPHMDDEPCGNFPGSELVMYTSSLDLALKQINMIEIRIEAWMDRWHVEVKKEVNFGHLDYACSVLNAAIHSYETVRCPLQESLSSLYDEETVREFILVKLETPLKRALDILSRIRDVKSRLGGSEGMNT